MRKDLLKGKYVLYENKGHKANGTRMGKVTNIVGNTLTVMDAYKQKYRINTENARIFGVLTKRKIRFKTQAEYIEEIEWS